MKLFFIVLFVGLVANAFAQIRPPAVPLIAMDPYMSIWSMADNLTDDWPRLWDGTIKGLVGLIRIDSQAFRFMGPVTQSGGLLPPAVQQISVNVLPTRTIYQFTQNSVQIEVTFTTPSFIDDFDLLSRPVTYISFTVLPLDGKNHNIEIYFDTTGEISVNTVDEKIVWNRVQNNEDLVIMRMGTSAQNVLGNSGDAVGIDWGYVYVASPNTPQLSSVMYGALEARTSFVQTGSLPTSDDTNMPRPCSDDWPVLAFAWNLSNVTPAGETEYIMFSYDDIYSLEYFGDKLIPYWKYLHDNITNLLSIANSQFFQIQKSCQLYDSSIILPLEMAGGGEYSILGALAYRQVLAGTKLVWNDKLQTMWYFMKEISSDGDVSTVDVVFPASPFYIAYSPKLLGLLVIPILAYANNETSVPYTYSFAPHHLGTWPIAYILPDQQENMPIEETGNLILMIATVAKLENSLDFVYPHYWKLLLSWGYYLVHNLPDPGNQLCTDDFEGPTPHDANLAVKGIIAIDAMSILCNIVGNNTCSQYFHEVALNYAKQWITLANPNNTDHFRLRYDQPGWSLKYNLLFQQILGLQTFPQTVFDMELSFYDENINEYGVPLDNRHSFTKFDWEFWTASMFSDKEDWETWVSFLYKFANETPNRVPLSDWYDTIAGTQTGFQARTVVGGIWAKMANPQSKFFYQ